MERITEQSSKYRHLENMSVQELTLRINEEDQRVALAIKERLPQINTLIEKVVAQLKSGGRLFYVGSGSGGRLSVLDAIEMPTTFGVPKGLINAVLAGGADRLTEALEEMEDDEEEGWRSLQENKISDKDMVIGISASGTTPYVLAALESCQKNSIPTGCLVSNPDSPIAAKADYPIEIVTGPEFITGSTRMKCGSVQKMVFDMISTTTMIRLGRVEDNNMVHVQLINNKITDRAVKMLMQKADIADYDAARILLLEKESVKKALDFLRTKAGES